jgi:hypothetical protein
VGAEREDRKRDTVYRSEEFQWEDMFNRVNMIYFMCGDVGGGAKVFLSVEDMHILRKRSDDKD